MNLPEQANLVCRALKADFARIEGLAVEIFWTKPGSVEVQRWSWEHQQWEAMVEVARTVERLQRRIAELEGGA